MASRYPIPSPVAPASPGTDGGAASEPKKPESFECDACGKRIEGEPAGHGLYIWTRGDEIRYEEPPLCQACANAIGLAALAQWELEEDGE